VISALVAGLARLVGGGTARWHTEPAAGRQRIFFANHSSHLDFVLIWSYLPPELRALVRPVAARDYWEQGRLRRYLASDVFNALLIDRTGPEPGAERGRKAVASILAGLGDRHSVILFPEGTRGTGQPVASFRSGLYHLARARPDVELVPVALENLNRILPKGEAIPVPMISRVTFGPELRLEPGEDKETFLERARRAVDALRET
jgi:1-acyl-sn-glycerol-3-phosphate acyltransferase